MVGRPDRVVNVPERLMHNTEEDLCWTWKSDNPRLEAKSGYPRCNGRRVRLIVFEYYFGVSPGRISSSCKNTWCVNPQHFIAVKDKKTIHLSDDVFSRISHNHIADICWTWRGTHQYHNRKHPRPWFRGEYAYRLVYRLFIGPIPDGYQVHHTCDRGWCVNPGHLQAKDQKGNLIEQQRTLLWRDPSTGRWESKS
jgi:HNH endonuclease